MQFIQNDIKIDKNHDLLAFIDEAGDEGFDEKSKHWFVVGSIYYSYAEYQKAKSILEEFTNSSNQPISKLHFTKLPHNKRKDVCAYLAESDYKVIYSAFSKRNFTEDEKCLCSYPSMYFVGIKNVIERGTWLCSQLGYSKVHFAISSRNRVELTKLDNYLHNANEAQKFLHYKDRLGKIVIMNNESIGNKFADIITSSMWQALEPMGRLNKGESSYFDICIKDNHLYNSTNPRFKGVWNNGFRCTPRDKDLVINIGNGILTEE